MDKFFSTFGKVALILLIVGGIAYGAYLFGRGSFTAPGFGGAQTTANPTPREKGLEPERVPTISGMNTPTGTASSVVSAGLDASSGLSFTKYQIALPQGWTSKHAQANVGTWTDQLTINHTNAAVTLKIFQGATGGAVCLYPSDADFEGPSSRYTNFEELKTADGVSLRRSWNAPTDPSKLTYTICQKASDGSWGQPTVFGHMSIEQGASDYNPLPEIDEMLKSLKKI